MIKITGNVASKAKGDHNILAIARKVNETSPCHNITSDYLVSKIHPSYILFPLYVRKEPEKISNKPERPNTSDSESGDEAETAETEHSTSMPENDGVIRPAKKLHPHRFSLPDKGY